MYCPTIKEGGHGWYQSIGLAFLYISALFLTFLKVPGPLNNKKRFSAVKQLTLGQVSIMWRPLQINSIAVCPRLDFFSIAVEDKVNLYNSYVGFSFKFRGFFT